MRNDFLERLKTEVMVVGGAIGTMLQAKGLKDDECSQEWNITHPEVVQSVIKAYYDVGCDIGGGNVVLSTRLHLKGYGLEDKVFEINYEGARIAKEITPEGCYLVGGSTSTGRILEPAGDITFDELYEAFREAIVAQAKGGIDIIWAVTMSDTEEARALIKAARDNTDLPVIATMAFNPGKKGFRTMMGIDPRKAAEELQKAGADVIGANCGGVSLEDTTTIIREMRGGCDKFLVAKPNAGLPQLIDGKPVWSLTEDEIVREVPKWIDAGANIVSLCCGSTPEDMARVVGLVKGKPKKNG